MDWFSSSFLGAGLGYGLKVVSEKAVALSRDQYYYHNESYCSYEYEEDLKKPGLSYKDSILFGAYIMNSTSLLFFPYHHDGSIQFKSRCGKYDKNLNYTSKSSIDGFCKLITFSYPLVGGLAHKLEYIKIDNSPSGLILEGLLLSAGLKVVTPYLVNTETSTALNLPDGEELAFVANSSDDPDVYTITFLET